MKNREVVILNITHGEHPCMNQPPFLPIAAGACRSDIINDACGDDNISAKNKWYGDFTSLYWAWKNLKGVDIIGTSHYRRYLSNTEDIKWHTRYTTWDDFSDKLYEVDKFKEELQNYDFLMSTPINLSCTVREQYLSSHPYPENLELVSKILKSTYPEALPYWEKYLNGQVFRRGYVFITTWQKFDDLCTWLYPILQRCEEKLNLGEYSGYQSRVIAFLYERLIPIYMDTYGKKIKYYPLCYITENQPSVYYERDENEQLYLTYKNQYESMRQSKAYRIGKAILKPFKWIRRK